MNIFLKTTCLRLLDPKNPKPLLIAIARHVRTSADGASVPAVRPGFSGEPLPLNPGVTCASVPAVRPGFSGKPWSYQCISASGETRVSPPHLDAGKRHLNCQSARDFPHCHVSLVVSTWGIAKALRLTSVTSRQ